MRSPSTKLLVLVSSLALPIALANCGGGTPASTTPNGAASASASTHEVPTDASASASAASATPAPSVAAAPPHWKYEGEEGPAHWGDLSADFATCKTGTSQTPIDLLSKKAEQAKKPAPLVFGYSKIPLKLKNNGHTVQVDAPDGDTLTAAGDTWSLVQFHFHTPSEHTLDGKSFDGEVHFVHKNAKGQLAVVGVMLKKGKENAALAPIWDVLPTEVTKDAKTIEGKSVDVSSLLSTKAGYYGYSGSLTTPPCSEGVSWFVLATPVEVSEGQLKKFHEATHGDTNRPVQPLGGRTVTFAK
jgi:carbonic anhydrase